MIKYVKEIDFVTEKNNNSKLSNNLNQTFEIIKDQISPIYNNTFSDCLNINLPQCKEIKKKIPKSRVVVNYKNWVLNEIDYNPYQQFVILFGEDNPEIDDIKHFDKIRQLARRQITNKIQSYHSQDIKKKILSEDFVNIETVMTLLKKCEFNCYYCRNPTQVLYKHVREPSQWTLERIDNNFGHNNNNVVIACLSCNLKRRRIYHERFIFTKQLNIIKKNC